MKTIKIHINGMITSNEAALSMAKKKLIRIKEGICILSAMNGWDEFIKKDGKVEKCA